MALRWKVLINTPEIQQDGGKLMKIHNIGRKNDFIVVTVVGRMDAVSAPDFEGYLNDLIADGALRIIVDFEALDYISSAGLRSVLITAKKIQAKNGEIMIVSLHDTVKEIFEISGFNTIIPVYGSVDAALETA